MCVLHGKIFYYNQIVFIKFSTGIICVEIPKDVKIGEIQGKHKSRIHYFQTS